MGKKLTYTQAETLLIFVILARSTSYVMMKMILGETGSFQLLGYRFLIAFLFLLPFSWKKLRKISSQTLLRGMLMGVAFFAVMTAEVFGLHTADASTASFLANTAIVFVPLFEALIYRRLPKTKALTSAALCLGGVALLTLKDGTFSLSAGELLCLLAAALYASSIILTDRVSKREDPLTLGILQIGFMAGFSLISAFLFETPQIPANSNTWGMILLLAIICTVFGFTLQPLAQRYVSSERAGLLCAFAPIGATISGILFLNESLESSGIAGIILILSGMIYGSLCKNRTKRFMKKKLHFT